MAALRPAILLAALALVACAQGDEVRLPVVAGAEDASSLPAEWPVCTIRAGGAVEIDGDVIEADAVTAQTIAERLLTVARAMPSEPMYAKSPDGPRAPGRPLVLRVDERVPYATVRSVLNASNHEMVRLWDFRVLVRREAGDAAGVLAFQQIKDIGPHAIYSCDPPTDEVVIDVGSAGRVRLYRMLPPRVATERTSARFDAGDRDSIRAYFEERATTTTEYFWNLVASDDVAWRDVLAVLSELFVAGHHRLEPLGP